MSHILGQVKRVMWGFGDSPVIWGVPVMVSDLTVYCQRSLRKAGVTSETVTLFDIVDWNNVNKLAIKQKKLKRKMGHREFIQCFINIVFRVCNNDPEMKAPSSPPVFGQAPKAPLTAQSGGPHPLQPSFQTTTKRPGEKAVAGIRDLAGLAKKLKSAPPIMLVDLVSRSLIIVY